LLVLVVSSFNLIIDEFIYLFFIWLHIIEKLAILIII